MLALLASLLVPLGTGDREGPEPSLEERRMGFLAEGLQLEEEATPLGDGRLYVPVNPVLWSPDGGRFAYQGVQAGERWPAIGEKTLGSYDYVSGPTFSENGALVVFRVGQRAGKGRESWTLLLNGESVGKEDWIGEVGVSPDGNRIAFWKQPGARVEKDGAYNQGRQVLVVGTFERDKWSFRDGDKWEDASSLRPPLFSRDGGVVATLAAKGGQWGVLLSGGKKERLEPKGGVPVIAFHALREDGEEVAYTAQEAPGPNEPARIVAGKKRYGDSYERVDRPVYAPGGAHLAYAFRRGGQWGLALDDEPGQETWLHVYEPVFTGDGAQMAFVTHTGGSAESKTRYLFPGEFEGGTDTLRTRAVRPGATTEAVATHEVIRDPVFSPDGARLAFRAHDAEGWRIVVGDTRSDAYDEVGPPRFSRDGKHVAFGARTKREVWWRVLAVP